MTDVSNLAANIETAIETAEEDRRHDPAAGGDPLDFAPCDALYDDPCQDTA